MSEKEDSFMNRYTEWIIRWRRPVIFVSVSLILLLAIGAKNLVVQQNYRIFFGKDNPQLIAFEAYETIYTRNDSHVFAIHDESGSVFNAEALRAVHELTEAAWKIPYSTRVDSITNYQHSWADGDELIVENLVSFDEELGEDAIRRAREVALSEPALAGNVVTYDEKTTFVNVRVEFPDDVATAIATSAAHSRILLDNLRTKYPNLRFELSGTGMLSNAFGEAPTIDAKFVFPAMFVLLVVFMVIFVRSFGGIVATLALIFLSTMGAMGAAGFYGYGINPANMASSIVVMTLAIADSVHILVSMFKELRKGTNKHRALIESMRINAAPIFLTSLTTAIGFLVLNFSDSPPYHELGNITATGVLLAWLLSMTFLPAVISMLPVRAPREGLAIPRMMSILAEFSIANRGKIVVASSGLIILALLSISRLEINDSPHEYFDESIEFRTASDFVAQQRGLYTFNMSASAGDPGGINDPRYLKSLDRFAEYLRARPEVAHVKIYSDTIKRLNMNLHGDDRTFYAIPEERDKAAQYLLLYEMSLPFGLDLNDSINVDKSATAIEVTFNDVRLADIKQTGLEAEQWLRENGEGIQPSQATGANIMFAYITDANIDSMVRGTLIGFGLISLVLMVSLRNVRLGIVSLVPNLVPAILAFGIWSIFVREVGFTITVVAGLSIGIIVDDTVHFLSKYARARREFGLNQEDAIRYTFRTVGQALLSTSLIVAGGFAVLTLSLFKVTVFMGALTSLTIACALLADFLLLPSLLLVLDRKKEQVDLKVHIEAA